MNIAQTTWPKTRPNLALALRSGATGGTVLNSWVFLLCLLGLIIVFADGLSRPSAIEAQEASAQPLSYEPYLGGSVFAFAMLPLMACYAGRAHLSKKEALLLWFVLCTVAYAKDFSYINVPGTKIFVTDIVLAVLTLSLLRFLRTDSQLLGRFTWLAVVAFVLAGMLAATRGLLSGQDKTLVMRDSAIAVYALFLPVGFLLVSSWDAVKRFFVFFAMGAVFSSVNGLAWFIAQPGQRRYLDYGPYVLISFLGVVVLATNRTLRPATGWLLASLLSIGIVMASARSIYVILGLVLAGTIFVGPSGGFRLHARNLRLIVWVGLFAAGLVWITSLTETGAKFLQSAGEDIVSGSVDYSEDDNANFRILAWLEAAHRFSEQPLVGEGYGIPFTFELSDSDPRPHNTYLTILYKMGLLGFLPLLWILLSFYWKGWQTLRFLHGGPEALLLYVLLIGQTVMSCFGLLNLLLESPFLACMFWLILGVGFRIILLSRMPRESSFTLFSHGTAEA
jgi:O-antigen ligase